MSGGEAAPAETDRQVDARALPLRATFADLVDAARALDEAGRTAGAAGCLLRGDTSARFEADVLAGARPLPSVPEALAARLDADAEPVNVLSAWGRLDPAVAKSEIVVIAFTTTTPIALNLATFVAFVTKTGVYLRGNDPSVRAQPGPLSVDALGLLLSQLGHGERAALYVTAESSIPVTELRRVLLAIPERYEVGLAVALPKGTRMPAEAKPNSELLCEDGLPAPRAEDPEGDIDTTALRNALSPLHDAALTCAQSSAGRAQLGGKLTLSLRIDAGGHAKDLCFKSDSIGEAKLRRCLAESVRALTLPKPDPSGFVDLELPLNLEMAGPSAQRALCN